MPVAKPASASAPASSVVAHTVLQQAFAATGHDWNRARLLAVQHQRQGIPSVKAVWTCTEGFGDIGVECDTMIVSTKR